MTNNTNETPCPQGGASDSWSWQKEPVWVYLSRLSPGSVRTMANAIHTIANMASDRPRSMVSFPWAQLRYHHTTAIRAALAARYKPATVNKMLAAMRGVLKECWKLGHMKAEDYQSAVNIPIVKATPILRGRALAPSEIASLLGVCSRDRNALGARDAALVAVLYGTALRRSEIVNLNISEYKPDSNELIVLAGKGGKDRVVYLPDGTKKAIRNWLKFRGSEAGPLFCRVSKGGRIGAGRLTGEGIWHILNKRGGQAGLESFAPHDLRRSCITNLLAGGTDVFVVQQLAGHSDPKTTMRYDRRGEEAKQTAAQKLRVPYFQGKQAA